SLGFVMFERWRRGAFLLGIVALGAAALRAVLSDERARLLASRTKAFDVLFLAGIGGVVLWLALSVDSLGTGSPTSPPAPSPLQAPAAPSHLTRMALRSSRASSSHAAPS